MIKERREKWKNEIIPTRKMKIDKTKNKLMKIFKEKRARMKMKQVKKYS